ncbi:MAG: hypothetical protein KGZ97_06475 [Bacteroidetes bacterium]|nr:hypothetical protein [Bacteroidota bacterium]
MVKKRILGCKKVEVEVEVEFKIKVEVINTYVMKSKLIFGLLILMFCEISYAFSEEPANDNEEKKQESESFFKLKGFVKSDYWYDSRSVVAAREDLFLLYPRNEFPDVNGFDIYGDPSFNFSAITSRIAGVIKGPDAFNAKTSGLIEADFSGVTNADINGFRLRHAYMKLEWEKFDLLLGQWWHPMFATEAVPTVISLNTGAPFQPFIRNPQVSLTYKEGTLRILAAAIAQRDNSNDGPIGVSPDYIRNSGMPNFHLQMFHLRENTTAGIAADYKLLRPRLATDSLYKTAANIGTYAFMGYLRYHKDKLDIKTKAIYGQNLSEHLMMGGYAESTVNPIDKYVTYTPLNHLSMWWNIVYGKQIQSGLFLGYSRNFGASDFVEGKIYGRGHNIKYLYRVSPHISFISGKMQFSTELEYTAAAYGTPDNRAIVHDTKEVSNIRLLFTAFYFF